MDGIRRRNGGEELGDGVVTPLGRRNAVLGHHAQTPPAPPALQEFTSPPCHLAVALPRPRGTLRHLFNCSHLI